jgi:hypothetical protein
METLSATDLPGFGGFRLPADDLPKPWRRRVWFLGTMGLPVALHEDGFLVEATKNLRKILKPPFFMV